MGTLYSTLFTSRHSGADGGGAALEKEEDSTCLTAQSTWGLIRQGEARQTQTSQVRLDQVGPSHYSLLEGIGGLGGHIPRLIPLYSLSLQFMPFFFGELE